MHPVQLVRHFWVMAIPVAALNATIYWFRAQRVVREKPEEARTLRAMIAYIAAWTALPFVVMGIGIMSGSTRSPFDYLYPRLGNPYVVGFHLLEVIGALGALYWILTRDGGRVLDRHAEVFLGGRWGIDAVRWRVFAAIGAPLIVEVYLWLGLAPELPPELTALLS